ncbi:basic secretory family protein [Pedobacter deserti]|uniref:basic secretory family protein n=1 Tax=Pedobacter deserti TaxID=2817382 RepID=UPI00210C4580|nr:basic secretory family protein [Pedobacter sp. SYSU D00382]
MIRNFIISAIFLGAALSAGAQNTSRETNNANRQRRGMRGYQVTILNNTKGQLDTARLRAAFNAVYPDFARADGYRTVREATMEVSDKFNGTISAKAGEIVINSKWLKKNDKNLEKALMHQFSKNWFSADTIKKDGYQLVFISKAPEFDPVVKQNLIDTYFKVYPTLVNTFNPKSTREVLFVVDTAYKAVAEASGNRILFSYNYMKRNPTDIDVVTHETMHIVQGYGYGSGPGWLTEGIADYVRYKYGVDNIGSKWALPEFNEKQSYTNAYRVTARFFEWLEQKVKPGLIATLDDQLRKHTYKESSWKELTGKTVDELWQDYAKAPELKLTYSGK